MYHFISLLLFSHSTTVVCTRMASSKPLPQRTPPTHGDQGDYEDRSRARREWSGAPFLPSLLTGRTPLHTLFTTMFTVIILVCSLKCICLPSFVLIGCCVSELHVHLCSYHNVWPEAVYWCFTRTTLFTEF